MLLDTGADVTLLPRAFIERLGIRRLTCVRRYEFTMMLYHILIAYLRILSQPRYQSQSLVPDGSDVLDCLAYGFSKLAEEIKEGDDIRLNDDTLKLLDDLDARLSQAASSSKHWVSNQEWESVHMFAWKIVESMRLDAEEVPKHS